MNPPKEKAMGDGLLVGLGVGFGLVAVVAVLGVVFGAMAISNTHDNVRRGWTLTPTLVANTDLKEGTPLTVERISRRQIPTPFVTKNTVLPADAAKLLERPLRFDVQAGDPLRWSDVELAYPPVRVLVASRDLRAGTTLSSDDVEERVLSSEFVGESWVRASDTGAAIGRTTVVPALKGDPLLWTHVPPKALK